MCIRVNSDVILFFAIVVVSYLLSIFGPSSQAFGNSMFFSGKVPVRWITGELPHITIQCLSSKNLSPASSTPQSNPSKSPSQPMNFRVAQHPSSSMMTACNSSTLKWQNSDYGTIVTTTSDGLLVALIKNMGPFERAGSRRLPT